ncbi:MAG: sulfatase [Promethearchaeota archaeon]
MHQEHDNIKNVFLLTIDCLRHDRLESGLMDNIKNFFNDGYIFDNAYSNAPWTPPSFSSIFTSTLPFSRGGYSPLPEDKKTIAEFLRSNGFTTCAINSNIWLTKYFNFHRGFNYYFDKKPRKNDFKDVFSRIIVLVKNIIKKYAPAIYARAKDNRFSRAGYFKASRRGYLNKNEVHPTAEEIVKMAIFWLKKIKSKKKFIWMHFLDIHHPFLPPKKFVEDVTPGLTQKEIFELNNKYRTNLKYIKCASSHFDEGDIEKIKGLYDAGVKYIDSSLKLFFEFIEDQGLKENSIVILTADHGELFLEHDTIEHPALFYDELIHVPLLLHAPRDLGKIDDGTFACSLDLVPTILSLVGLPMPGRLQGHSLLEKKDDNELIVSQTYINKDLMKMTRPTGNFKTFSFRNKKWKYIYNASNNSEELYNVASDPKEKKNLIHENLDIIKFFRKSRDVILKAGQEQEKLRIKNSINLLKFKKKF